MKSEILGILGKRLATAVTAFAAGAALVGGSYAAIGSKGAEPQSPEVEAVSAEAPEPADTHEAVKGGPVERFHEAECNLVDTSGFEGNWTHGAYVAAVAAAGGDVATAAKSDCGKPMSAVHPESTESPAPHGKSGETHGKSGEPHGQSAEHTPDVDETTGS